MLTVSEDEEDVAGALRAGAIGYVLKGVSARDLVDILVSVARGEAHVHQRSPRAFSASCRTLPSRKDRDRSTN